MALTLGLFCAAAPALPALACAALAGAPALLLGADSAIDNLRAPGALTLLAGSALSAALMVFYLAALTERLQQTWQRIGVRIVGS